MIAEIMVKLSDLRMALCSNYSSLLYRRKCIKYSLKILEHSNQDSNITCTVVDNKRFTFCLNYCNIIMWLFLNSSFY